jgi:hypothetical protein
MKETSWITLFLKNSGGLSSKRLLAIVGFFTCIILLVAAFITGKEVPEFGDIVLISCLSLYGVEIIPSIWSKNINKS